MKTAKSAPVGSRYDNIRSSGYLKPKYLYRKPPVMSWLDIDDIDLNDIDGDDRSKSPEPQLDDFIQKVLHNKRVPITKKKENAYKSALYLATNIVEAIFENEDMITKYCQSIDGKPVISDFRAIDKNVYVGLVPLKKPSRLDSFMVSYKSPGELPTHRMLVHINKKLTKEERLNVVNEWGHCLDSLGYLRPDYVLCWFNKGLVKACGSIEVENKRTQKLAFLETSLADDGTIWIHIIGFDPQDKYKINIVPCIPLTEIPKQLYLIAPVPCRRPYNTHHHKFLKQVHDGIKSGDELLILEARLEKWSNSLRCSPTLEISWSLHIGQLEDRGFAFLNSLSPTKIFENIIILINAIKEDHTFCLHAVSNRVINHAIFYQFRKSLGKMTKVQDWFLAVLDTIQVQLGLQFFPNFFLPKQNILMEKNSDILKFNKEEINRLIRCIKANPELICVYSECGDVPKNNDDYNEDNENKETSDENTETSDENTETSDENTETGDENPETGHENTGKNGVRFID